MPERRGVTRKWVCGSPDPDAVGDERRKVVGLAERQEGQLRCGRLGFRCEQNFVGLRGVSDDDEHVRRGAVATASGGASNTDARSRIGAVSFHLVFLSLVQNSAVL
jgi:hypothetical protein